MNFFLDFLVIYFFFFYFNCAGRREHSHDCLNSFSFNMNVLSKRSLPNPFAENDFPEKRSLLPLLSESCYTVCVGYSSGLVLGVSKSV